MNQIKINGFLFKNEILFGRFSLGITPYFESNEIRWIKVIFYKYMIILNILTISLFFGELKGIENFVLSLIISYPKTNPF